jgi:16S rRNA (adenine1518-N6/adenine1519-N6)-dimethyltransferase
MSRRFSQHFLTDRSIAERIVGFANIRPGDIVLEIGPGHGELSEIILDRGAKLTAIEIDRRLAAQLSAAYPEMKVIVGDATKAELPECDLIISNVPYHVTSPLLMRILDHKFRYAVLTVQKEYADRMVAGPGTKDYSRLSVSVYCRARCELLGSVPPGAFSPPPRVSSAIVGLRPRRFPFEVKETERYYDIVRLLFSHRRKMIGTTVRRQFELPPGTNIPFERQRVEELTPEEIGKISDFISGTMR